MPEALRGVVLDFDGVILQSVDIKTRAFETVFADEAPADVARVMEYHRAHNGISRYEKFRWAYREVFKRPLSEEAERALGERYNALVEDAVSRCAFVPGALEFLKAASRLVPLFVASGTPETELRRIVLRRGLAEYFRGVFGAPTTKDEILRRVAASLACAPAHLAMIGDAMTDHDAAQAVGASFIGIGPAEGFPRGTRRLPDLRGLEAALLALAP